MRRANGLLLSVLTLAALAAAHRETDAAGFDCKRAKTMVEKQICGVPELSKLDGEVAALYTRALAAISKDEIAAMREEQRGWLHEREECQDMIRGNPPVVTDVLACIRTSTSDRKARLDAVAAHKALSW